MTANLKRFDPAGTDGSAATATGNLTSVIIAGAGAVTYEADYGMDRGSNMGLRAVAPGTADQANTTHSTTAAANGSGQVYGSFENWPTGGNQEFMTLRTASGNCIRQVVSTAGSVTVQNQAGSTVATLGTISLNTRYRFELEATPGTTTSNGSGRARIYDDSDTLVYDSGALTAGNYGGGLATKTVSVLRVADPTTATVSAFAFGFTQPAIDTDASAPPTITPVTKAVAYTKTVDDPAGASDAVGIAREVTVTDGAGITDTDTDQALGVAVDAADTAGGTDSTSDVLAAARPTSDAAGGSDSTATIITAARSLSDAAGATDATTPALGAARTAADGAGATDSTAAALAAARTVSDPAGATDDVSIELIGPAASAVDDNAGATDSVSMVRTTARTQSDAAGVSDQVLAVLERVRTVDDLLGVIDAAQAATARQSGQAEAVGASDSVEVTFFRSVLVADALGLDDLAVPWRSVEATPAARTVRPRLRGRTVEGGGSRTIRAMKRRQ